ncbi:MAG: hypothetical protein AAF721_21130 [Myxococcota bacterium]
MAVCAFMLAPDAHATKPPTARKPGRTSPSNAPKLPKVVLPTKHSVFIPCFEFTNTRGAPADYEPGLGGCRIKNVFNHLDLVAAVQFPATETRAWVTRVRCYGNVNKPSGTGEIKARLWEYEEPAAMTVRREVAGGTKKFTGGPGTLDVVPPASGAALDPLSKHYLLDVEWRIGGAKGAKYFKGCRVDWSVAKH